MNIKIISGGQTGADQGGLEAGKALRLETGGTAPLGWRTEVGARERLLKSFGLTECPVPGYPARTKVNVLSSDATVIFGNIDEPGSSLTLNLCHRYKKPYLINPCATELMGLIEVSHVKTLNVAGNRESKNPDIQRRVKTFLVEALRMNYQTKSQSVLILEGRRSQGMSLAATALTFRLREYFGQRVMQYPKVTFKPCYDSSDVEKMR